VCEKPDLRLLAPLLMQHERLVIAGDVEEVLMRMVGALLGAGALGSLVAWFTFAASTPALPTGPLAGLTEYGRTVWNLEALLRDRFGKSQCLA
jgi:hypothetical protein